MNIAQQSKVIKNKVGLLQLAEQLDKEVARRICTIWLSG
uniref:Uncharacterized protein n=1 Tax=Curvibacter symbiont subsp. Hydra magnipapillata TaxID=667019 RepID=C9Y982_CURXX|nr:hypothetical protein Csp_A06830 [Curvibacter putative symbiont of Hydra magnipapillata]